MYAAFALRFVPHVGRWQALRGLVLGACLAVPMLAATAQPASASCGDWLDHAMSANRQADGHAGALLGALPHSERQVPPCNGPHCGQAPHAPAPFAPAAAPPSSKDYGCRAESDVCLTGAGAALSLSERTPGLLSGYPRRIDRPPRV